MSDSYSDYFYDYDDSSDEFYDYDDSSEEFSDDDEYTDEDDENFIDPEIMARVKAEMEMMKTRIAEAALKNDELVATIDKDKVEKIKSEQVEVVGSLKLYERINRNFMQENFEPIFAKEQFDLYKWREDFFHSSFPGRCWFTDGGDDKHSFDTVPYQITKNFQKVLDLACSNRNCELDRVYFENDEIASARARDLFDISTVMYRNSFLDKNSLEYEDLSYSDAAHVIVAVYQSSPLKLEHLAMKKVLEHEMPLDELPEELQDKAEIGMFDESDDIPDYINDQGREAFEILRRSFGITNEENIDDA